MTGKAEYAQRRQWNNCSPPFLTQEQWGNHKADPKQTKRTHFPTQHIIKLKNWRSCGCSRSTSRSWTENELIKTKVHPRGYGSSKATYRSREGKPSEVDMCLYRPHRCLLSTVLLPAAHRAFDLETESRDAQAMSVSVPGRCAAPAATWEALTQTLIWPTAVVLYLRLKHHLHPKQDRRDFTLQEKHTTIFCIMRGQEEIYLPASVSHEELNSQAQVKEPTLPIVCSVIL